MFYNKKDGLQLKEEMLWLTCSIKSLYMSIQHFDMLKVMRYFISMSNLETHLCEFILDILELIFII